MASNHFAHKQSTAGVLLIIAALLSLTLANSPWKAALPYVSRLELGFVFNQSHWTPSVHD
jgi:Na+/H+ antiporter NhaA